MTRAIDRSAVASPQIPTHHSTTHTAADGGCADATVAIGRPASALDSSRIPPRYSQATPSIAAAMAYDEYVDRLEQGQRVVASEFCEEFPVECRYLLRRYISVHCGLDDDPSLLDGVALDEPAFPQPGDIWQGYELLEEIGRGGLARVFLAAELSAGRRPVVLKITPFETGEGHLQSKLTHDHVVPVYTVRHDELTGLTAIVMPYWGRATLHDVRERAALLEKRGQELPAQLIADVARQRCGAAIPTVPGASQPSTARTYRESIAQLATELADALAHTHAAGVLHRDLKPTNILLAPNGRPMLMDFNLSATVDQADFLLGGTIPYMPPELLGAIVAQWQRGSAARREREESESVESALVDPLIALDQAPTVRAFRTHRDDSGRHYGSAADPRSDLFALGVILYEMLCGQLPFGEPDRRWALIQQARWMQDEQQRSPPDQLPGLAQLDPAWRAILVRCLAANPEQRFQDATELSVALRPLTGFVEPVRRNRGSAIRRTVTRCGTLATLAIALLLPNMAQEPAPVDAQPTPVASGFQSAVPVVVPWDEAVVSGNRNRVTSESRVLRETSEIATAIRHLLDDKLPYERLDVERAKLQNLLNRAPAQRGMIRALIGFCYTLREEHRRAVEEYEQALNAAEHVNGKGEARTLNNLAYSYQRVGNTIHALESASSAIGHKHADATTLAVAYQNRATAAMKLFEAELRKACDGPPNPEPLEQILSDIEMARRLGAKSVTFYHLAGRLYATANYLLPNDAWRVQAIADLTMAVKLGLPRSSLTRSSPAVRELEPLIPSAD